jgi:hypothetical protein
MKQQTRTPHGEEEVRSGRSGEVVRGREHLEGRLVAVVRDQREQPYAPLRWAISQRYRCRCRCSLRYEL